MNSCLGYILFFLLVTGQLAAQEAQNRFEILIQQEEQYDVVSAGARGLFVVVRDLETHSYKVTRLDTTFKFHWTRTLQLDPSHRHLSAYFDGSRLNLLVTGVSLDFFVHCFALDGTFTDYKLKNYVPMAFHSFKVADKVAVISGYYNYRPVVIIYQLSNPTPTLLPGMYELKSEVNQVEMNGNGTIDILLTQLNAEREQTTVIKSYDFQGNFLSNIILDPQSNKSLLFAQMESLPPHNKIIAGVYGRKNSEYSRGVFVANIDGADDLLQYYNYAEFKNFFNYMKAKRERRVRQRIERRLIKNKKIKFRYRLLVHDLIKYGDEYLLLGEAFYPKYKSVMGDPGSHRSIYTVNRGMFQTSLIFEGYQYTHAIVIAFDQYGEVSWDNSFEINDVISQELKQFVHVNATDEVIELLYVYDNTIRSKTIQHQEVVEGEQVVDLQLKYSADRLIARESTLIGLNSWYDNVFYTYGIQTITQDIMGGSQTGRKVFFINKIQR